MHVPVLWVPVLIRYLVERLVGVSLRQLRYLATRRILLLLGLRWRWRAYWRWALVNRWFSIIHWTQLMWPPGCLLWRPDCSMWTQTRGTITRDSYRSDGVGWVMDVVDKSGLIFGVWLYSIKTPYMLNSSQYLVNKYVFIKLASDLFI